MGLATGLILKKGLPNNIIQSEGYREDRGNIFKWLILVLVKRIFGKNPDTMLKQIRTVIAKSSDFPLEQIIEQFRGEQKSLIFDDDNIEALLGYCYGDRYTFSVLALLYPSFDFRNNFHIDHIYPKSFFTETKLRGKNIKDIPFYMDNFNCIANLQFLEAIPNQEKSCKDFASWLTDTYSDDQARKDFMAKHYIPDIDLNFDNFETFIKERSNLIRKKFRSILKTTRNC